MLESAHSLSKRLAISFGVLLGLCSVSAVEAQAQAPASVAPPQSWIVYAGEVQAQVAALLASDEEAAARLRVGTMAAFPDLDNPPPPFVVNLWINPEGLISQARFQTSGVVDLDQALGRLLVGRRLASPPPNMTNPLRMRLRIEPDIESARIGTPSISSARPKQIVDHSGIG